MSNTTIHKSCFFNASRETVWSYLTDKDKLGEWFHPSIANLADGEDYALVEKNDKGEEEKVCWGTVLEMDKPNTLVYSFTVGPLKGELTTVTWTLEEIKDGTKLTLTHEGISKAAGDAAIGLLMALDKGWDKHLDTLREKVIATFSSDAEA
ncbi:MAG: SRPBCC domain-containing protein [Cocleimonas sp.]